MAGLQDSWRRFLSDDRSMTESFETEYRLSVWRQRAWRKGLNSTIAAEHWFAFGTHEVFARESERVGAATLLPDGAHPSDAGGRLLSDLGMAEHE